MPQQAEAGEGIARGVADRAAHGDACSRVVPTTMGKEYTMSHLKYHNDMALSISLRCLSVNLAYLSAVLFTTGSEGKRSQEYKPTVALWRDAYAEPV